MDRADVENWVSAYLRAWSSNEPEDIRALFTEDAAYYTAPFRPPWRGHEEIVREWIGRKDEPGQWTFRWELLAISEDLAFIRGWTGYPGEADYSNLWVVRLASNDRASEFTEWWMEEDKE